MRQVEEQFQTYTESGEPLDLVDRSIVHQRGDWHRAVQVFLFRSNEQLLVQQRAKNKDVCPGLWDLSVAEHLQPGESYLDAAHRGLAEELGVRNVALEPIGEERSAVLEISTLGIIDREFQRCYFGTSEQAIEPDPAEVAATAYFDLEKLRVAMSQTPGKFTPWFLNWANSIRLIEVLLHERRQFLG